MIQLVQNYTKKLFSRNNDRTIISRIKNLIKKSLSDPLINPHQQKNDAQACKTRINDFIKTGAFAGKKLKRAPSPGDRGPLFTARLLFGAAHNRFFAQTCRGPFPSCQRVGPTFLRAAARISRRAGERFPMALGMEPPRDKVRRPNSAEKRSGRLSTIASVISREIFTPS